MANATRVLRTTTVHAARRAEEADIAQAILEELGIEPVMTRAAVSLLGKIAKLGLRERLGGVAPDSLERAVELMDERGPR
jgi:hypothetical protein